MLYKFILRFHKDLKEMWRQTASRAELKILFETERIHPYFIRLCSVEGSSMVWELLDPSSTLKYAKFITVLEVVAHSTFFPAGSFKRVQFNVKNFITCAISNDEISSFSQNFQFFKNVVFFFYQGN